MDDIPEFYYNSEAHKQFRFENEKEEFIVVGGNIVSRRVWKYSGLRYIINFGNGYRALFESCYGQQHCRITDL